MRVKPKPILQYAGQKKYANGKKTYKLDGNQLTYFSKDGKVKAKGPFKNDTMEGEWKFYRKTGQLWQVGNFKNGKNHGPWVRYDKMVNWNLKKLLKAKKSKKNKLWNQV